MPPFDPLQPIRQRRYLAVRPAIPLNRRPLVPLGLQLQLNDPRSADPENAGELLRLHARPYGPQHTLAPLPRTLLKRNVVRQEVVPIPHRKA